MNILFLIMAVAAAIGALFALFKPDCGSLVFCKERRWMPAILWLTILVIALAFWRSATPADSAPEVIPTGQGTVAEQSNSSAMDEEPAANLPENSSTNKEQTLKEKFDKTMDDAAGAAADAYNATRETMDDIGKAAAETFEDVKDSASEAF